MNQPSIERGADDQTFHDVIEAYCGALSYAPGETATVHVSTHAAAYDVVVERWGGERTIAWAANTVPGTFQGGSFRQGGLAPGTWTLRVELSSGEILDYEVVLETGHVELTPPPF